MTQAAGRFCVKCGREVSGAARFCPGCGAQRTAAPEPQQAGGNTAAGGTAPAAAAGGSAGDTSAPGVVAQAGTAAGQARRVVHHAQRAASYAGMATALPWQTVTAGQAPDLGAFLRQAGVPVGTTVARRVVRRSVRKPALALLFTTLLDLVVGYVSGQPAALGMMAMRFLSGTGTGLLGLLVGRRGGFFRGLVGLGSLVTALLQLVNSGGMLLAAIQGDSSFFSLLPSLVSTVSVIVVATKTALMTLRRLRGGGSPAQGAAR